jgi:hypothetical protein
MSKLRRLPHSAETKAKISAALFGSKKSPEARENMAAAKRGRTLSAETKAKISAARRARKGMTDADRAEECRLRNWNRMYARGAARNTQWKIDKFTAAKSGQHAVLRDLIESWGWTSKRKILNVPGISNGFCHKEKKIVWAPQQ